MTCTARPDPLWLFPSLLPLFIFLLYDYGQEMEIDHLVVLGITIIADQRDTPLVQGTGPAIPPVVH
ncbi:hypothetical protein DPF_0266 [Desulfoplanes formicivorans]|uniref:Uncharacterized protein n=1 Tax=Desulfoplanes formicivorans TaxID=1592317 RepID=A0A194AEP9_9BACT|nr:hypothetical protein DPF_0266 [Desulfoplanes formicivorans]